jgi:Response regulators consisting of a CheY-like receiver domain and a winged-helix DNA-binding domain
MQKTNLEPFSEGSQPARKLVAIIDDSITVRKIVETCLRREGFAVQCFPDGLDALRTWIQPDVRLPDLILLDLCLPELDGYEVLLRIKRDPRLSSITVIILSRRDGLLDKLKGRLCGARAHLGKPFKTQELLTVVNAYLGSQPSRTVSWMEEATLAKMSKC